MCLGTGCDAAEPEPSVRVEAIETAPSRESELAPMEVPGPARPGTSIGPSAGQRLYVPVYSNVSFGSHTGEATVAVRLMIRNVSETDKFKLTRVDYYDSAGKQVESVVRAPVEVTALQTRSFLVESSDLRAGPGGNFIVEWRAAKAVVPPMVETVNGYANVHQAFAFGGGARVLEELSGH